MSEYEFRIQKLDDIWYWFFIERPGLALARSWDSYSTADECLEAANALRRVASSAGIVVDET